MVHMGHSLLPKQDCGEAQLRAPLSGVTVSLVVRVKQDVPAQPSCLTLAQFGGQVTWRGVPPLHWH